MKRDLNTFCSCVFQLKTEIYICYVVNNILNCLFRIKHTALEKYGTTVTETHDVISIQIDKFITVSLFSVFHPVTAIHFAVSITYPILFQYNAVNLFNSLPSSLKINQDHKVFKRGANLLLDVVANSVRDCLAGSRL